MSTRFALAALLFAALRVSAFQLEQLTCAPTRCGNGNAHLTGDGRRIVFSSTCDLVAGSNADGHYQFFTREVDDGRVTQLTPADPTGGLGPGYPAPDCSPSSFNVATDYAGRRIAMVAACRHSTGSISKHRWRVLDYREGEGLKAGPWVPCALGMLPGGMSADGKRLVVEGDCHPLRGRRRSFRQRLYLQDAPRRGFKRLGPAGCVSFWAALNDDGLLVFNSNCRKFVGLNPAQILNLVALDRNTGSVRQLTTARAAGCGGFSLYWDGFIVPPAVSAAGHVAVGASCLDFAAPVLRDPPNEVLYLAGPGGPLEQATFNYCVTDPGTDGSPGHNTMSMPVSLSADGSAVAFSMFCGVFGRDFPQTERRVFVLRPAGTPRVLEVVSLKDTGHTIITSPSMDAAGRALVISSNAPLGGCPSNGTFQLYLVRHLDDPTPGPTVCACAPGG